MLYLYHTNPEMDFYCYNQLYTHLTDNFMTKLFIILKNFNKDSYIIGQIFKEIYPTKLIDLTDDPLIDLDKTLGFRGEITMKDNSQKTITKVRKTENISFLTKYFKAESIRFDLEFLTFPWPFDLSETFGHELM